MLSRGEQLALVRHVLSAMLVHIMLPMALTPAFLKRVNRLIRIFLWHGRKEANAEHCLVNWPKVCRPLSLGGLGVCNLQRSDIAPS